jgi:hypothetical protein
LPSGFPSGKYQGNIAFTLHSEHFSNPWLCFCAKNKTTIGNSTEVVTQKNAAMVEETNAAGANPASEASQLHDLISQFNLGADSHDDKHVATATE